MLRGASAVRAHYGVLRTLGGLYSNSEQKMPDDTTGAEVMLDITVKRRSRHVRLEKTPRLTYDVLTKHLVLEQSSFYKRYTMLII